MTDPKPKSAELVGLKFIDSATVFNKLQRFW